MRFDNEDMYSGTSLKRPEGILEKDIVVVFSQNNEVITSKVIRGISGRDTFVVSPKVI